MRVITDKNAKASVRIYMIYSQYLHYNLGNSELITLKKNGVKSLDLVRVVQKDLANQNKTNPTVKPDRPELNRQKLKRTNKNCLLSRDF